MKELLLCAAVCQEQQAGLRLSAIQVGQGTHYSFNNFDSTGLVTTLCVICSAEVVVLCFTSESPAIVPRFRGQNFGFLVIFKLSHVLHNLRNIY